MEITSSSQAHSPFHQVEASSILSRDDTTYWRPVQRLFGQR